MCYTEVAGQGREHGGFCFQEPARALTTAYRCGQSPRSIGTPRAVLAGSAGIRWDGGSVMIVKVCRQCGREFQIYPSREREGRAYCSEKCSRQAHRWEATVLDRFWAKVDKSAGPDGCWFWTAGTSKRGYGMFRVRPGTDGGVAAHRFAYEESNGPIPDGLCACHHCDNPLCVNPSHIFPGTHADNMADRARKGRYRGLQGEDHPAARLTEADVKEIRRLYQAGQRDLSALAERFGVLPHTVYQAATRRTWRHIPP